VGWLIVYLLFEALAILLTFRALHMCAFRAASYMLTFAEFIPGVALSDAGVASIVRLASPWALVAPIFFYVLTLFTVGVIIIRSRRTTRQLS
jgi:hypothetical protein